MNKQNDEEKYKQMKKQSGVMKTICMDMGFLSMQCICVPTLSSITDKFFY